jgi:hypothetical protein
MNRSCAVSHKAVVPQEFHPFQSGARLTLDTAYVVSRGREPDPDGDAREAAALARFVKFWSGASTAMMIARLGVGGDDVGLPSFTVDHRVADLSQPPFPSGR